MPQLCKVICSFRFIKFTYFLSLDAEFEALDGDLFCDIREEHAKRTVIFVNVLIGHKSLDSNEIIHF